MRRALAALVATLALAAGAAAHNTHTVSLDDVSWADPKVRNLHRIARCETGGKPGQNGRPDWDHHNSRYTGALGFTHRTWAYYKRFVRPVPKARFAAQATPREQYAVGLVLLSFWPNYSSWPACSRRLGPR